MRECVLVPHVSKEALGCFSTRQYTQCSLFQPVKYLNVALINDKLIIILMLERIQLIRKLLGKCQGWDVVMLFAYTYQADNQIVSVQP